jgi:hypothetical protein
VNLHAPIHLLRDLALSTEAEAEPVALDCATDQAKAYWFDPGRSGQPPAEPAPGDLCQRQFPMVPGNVASSRVGPTDQSTLKKLPWLLNLSSESGNKNTANLSL